jgi:hypothetical protein
LLRVLSPGRARSATADCARLHRTIYIELWTVDLHCARSGARYQRG